MDDRFLFLVIGILASLRAVQHMLVNHDRKLSPQHKAAIDEWKKLTPMNVFIEKSRNMILKEGSFPGGAGFRLAEFDPDGAMRRVPRRWEAYYYDHGKPRDLNCRHARRGRLVRSAIVVNRTACAGHQYGGRQRDRLSGRHLVDTRQRLGALAPLVERARYVVMKRPPLGGHSALGRGCPSASSPPDVVHPRENAPRCRFHRAQRQSIKRRTVLWRSFKASSGDR